VERLARVLEIISACFICIKSIKKCISNHKKCISNHKK